MIWLLGCAPGDAPLTTEQAQRQKYVDCSYVTAVDEGFDGAVEHTLIGAFDGSGWPIRYERWAPGGVLEYQVLAENDPFGNPVHYTEDYDADGVVDYRRTGRYTSDGVPRVIEEDLLYQDEVDDLRTTYVLRGGALVSGERRSLDPALAALDEDYAYQTDADGRVVQFDRRDAARDALVQRTWTVWDGDVASEERVEDWSNGAILGTVETAWTRDEGRRVVVHEVVATPADGPATVWSTTYVYDGDAPRPTTAETMVTAAGLELRRDLFSWEYDEGFRATVYRTPADEQTTTWTCE